MKKNRNLSKLSEILSIHKTKRNLCSDHALDYIRNILWTNDIHVRNLK